MREDKIYIVVKYYDNRSTIVDDVFTNVESAYKHAEWVEKFDNYKSHLKRVSVITRTMRD